MSSRLILDWSTFHLHHLPCWNLPRCRRCQQLQAVRPWKILRRHGINGHLWLVPRRILLPLWRKRILLHSLRPGQVLCTAWTISRFRPMPSRLVFCQWSYRHNLHPLQPGFISAIHWASSVPPMQRRHVLCRPRFDCGHWQLPDRLVLTRGCQRCDVYSVFCGHIPGRGWAAIVLPLHTR